jgi:hypothetical protein
MSESELSAQVAAEIRALHVEFERWNRGESESSERIEASIPEDFTFVTPQGEVVTGRELRENFRQGQGQRQIRIRIENPILRWHGGDAVLATYEEWHEHADYTTARQSTVLFTRDAAAPGGLRWRHVHETWMLPPPKRL